MDLWNINVIHYCAILGTLEKNNTLKEKNLQPKIQMKSRWLIIHQQKINNIRRKISYISVILRCQNSTTPLTKHQETIKVKLKNESAKWIEMQERKHCNNTVSKNYQINLKAF